MSLHQQQYAFTSCIRNSENAATMPHVPQPRLALYRELFFNNIAETLSNAFPIVRRLLDENTWQYLCRTFFARHRCHTPYLSHVPGEFVEFIKANDINEPPWLLELAHWQWTELELFLAADPPDLHAPGNDPLHDVPVLSPLLRLHACRYPVHRIGTDGLRDDLGDEIHYLLAWRRHDNRVGFMQLNDLSRQMIQLLQTHTQFSGLALLKLIANRHPEIDPALIMAGGTELLHTFYNSNIIVGGRELPTQAREVFA